MGLPRKKPLASADRISKALEAADNHTAEKKAKEMKRDDGNPKKVGRPRLAGDRSTRTIFYSAQETAARIEIAFLNEKLKFTKAGKKIDKSLFIENIIKEWLDKKGY